MKEKTDKLITYCGMGVALLCTLLAILFAINNGKDVKSLADIHQGGFFDITFIILAIMAIGAIGAMVIFWFRNLFVRFHEESGYAKKFLIIVGAIVVVCLVALLLAKGNDITPAMMDKYGTTEKSSKLIGAACNLVYFCVALTVIMIVYVEASKMSKKK